MATPRALKADTRVGAYALIQAVDINHHGVVYRARVDGSSEEVWLQEFLPSDIAGRQRGNLTVRPRRGKTRMFEEALTLFLQEARILSQIRDPYIVRVREYTEARGTAFIAMNLEQGHTLDEYLQQNDRIPEKQLQQLVIPLLKGLRVAHSGDLLHRDLNPKNIFIRNTGPPLIMGFGSTQRILTTGEVGLGSRVTPGYSAIEQYHEQENLGPWTDFYAMGAVLYRCISGITPIDATKRVIAIAEGKPDPLVPAIEVGQGEYNTNILNCIDWLLQPVADKRPESAGQILTRITESAAPKPVQEAPKTPDARQPQAPTPEVPKLYVDPETRAEHEPLETDSPNYIAWAVGVVLLFGLLLFVFWPQLYPDPVRTVAGPSGNIEGTNIPKDILDQPIPEVQPPELPESVEFTRKADDFRADEYRKIDQYDQTVRTLLESARVKFDAGKLISPPSDNAFQDFRSILVVDIDNFDALQGIDEITSLLLQRAEYDFSQGRFEAARKELDAMHEAGLKTNETLALLNRIDELYANKMASEGKPVEKLSEDERSDSEKLAEQQRIEQIERDAEAKRTQQAKLAEQERIERIERDAEAKRTQQEKLAEQQRIEQIERDAEAKRTQQEKLAEQQRIEQIERDAEAKRTQQEKLAEQQRIEQIERDAEAKRTQQAKLAEQERIERIERDAEAERIQQAKLAEQERIAVRVTELLALAKATETQTGVAGTGNGDPITAYREVLRIDPDNEQANEAISKIVEEHIELTIQALAQDRFDEVEDQLQTIAAIEPGNETVELLRDQLDIRRRVVEQDQLRLQADRQQEQERIAETQLLEQKRRKIDRLELEQGVSAYYRGNYRIAYDVLKPLAENGNDRAQFRVGMMYLRGRGIDKDPNAGKDWISRAFPAIQSAATSGEAWAQADLGSLYQRGLLVAQNDIEAARWYLLAAEQGYAGAQTNLGAMYADGIGVARDRGKAIKWLKLAAEQGDKIALDNLAILGVQESNSRVEELN